MDPHTETGPDMSGGTIGRWATVGGVLLACALVALGTSNGPLSGPPNGLDPQTLSVLRMVGAGAIVVGFIGLLRHHGSKRRDAPPSDSVATTLSRAFMIMALVALMAQFRPTVPNPTPTEGPAPPPDAGRIDASLPPAPSPEQPATNDVSTDGFSLEEGREYEEGPASEPIEIPEETPPLPDSEPAFDWTILQRIAGITLTLLLLAAAVMAVRGFWPGRRRRGVEDFFPGEDPFLAPTLWMASQVSRDFDLSDPRERVLHAYHQLLFALGRVGSPRYLHEGPMEHLSRAEARFPLPRGPLRGLGRLYVRAEYDRRPMEWEAGSQADEMLDQSLTALWDARPDLRPTAGGQ